MLGGTRGIYSTHARVEAASQDCRQASFLETLAVGPLPAVLEVCLVTRLIVSGVEVVHSTFQTCVHDGEVLIGQCHVNHQLGLMALEQSHQFRHAVGIDFVGGDIGSSNSFSHCIAFRLVPRCDYYLVKHVGIFSALVCHNGSHTATADDDYFVHNVVYSLGFYAYRVESLE